MKTHPKKHGLLFSLASFCLVVLAAQAIAATYYIDFDAGNDANTGTTTAAPWKHTPGDAAATANVATTTLTAGDIVQFKGGVRYKGTIDVKWDGTALLPILYLGTGWGTGKAIIDGEGKELGINARQYGFHSTSRYTGATTPRDGQDHWIINGFKITNLRLIYPDSEQPYGISVEGPAEDLEVGNCDLYQIKPKPIPVTTEAGTIGLTVDTLTDQGQNFTAFAGTPGSVAIHSINLSWLISGGKSDYYRATGYFGEIVSGDTHTVRIYKDIYLTQPGWNYYSGFPPISPDNSGYFYWIFKQANSAFYYSGGIGIEISGCNNVRIVNNTVRDCRAGITIGASGQACNNLRVSGNDISRTCWGIVATAGGYAGENLDGTVIDGNTLHDFAEYVEYGWGWHIDGIFLFNAGPTNLATITNTRISRNTFYGDIGDSTALLYISGNADGVRIFNNAFGSSAGGGYQIRTIGDRNVAPTVKNVKIYNNLFAHIPGERKYLLEFENSANITLRNNIMFLPESYGGTFAADTTATQGFSSDYNLLTTAHIYDSAIGLGSQIYTLENWINNTPHDQHSILRQNPLLRSFPSFATLTTGTGTTSRAYLQANTNPNYNHTFVIDDYIEYNYDHIVRTVTAVGTDYIEFSPALTRPPRTEEAILNWKTINTFIYDFHLAIGSPCIDSGINLSSEIDSTDIAGTTRPKGTAWDMGPYEYVSGSTDTTPPTVPTNLAGTAASASQINLSWTASTDDIGVAGYRIYRDSALAGATASTTYTDTGVTTGATYTYTVAAFDAAGNASPDCSAVSVLVHDELYTTFSDWVGGNFSPTDQTNAAISGPAADADGAGLTNLERYAFGLPARGPAVRPVGIAFVDDVGNRRPALTFTRKGYASDIEYVVQTSSDLANWTDLPTVFPGYPKEVTVIDTLAPASAPRRFLRIRITQP